MKYNDDGDDDDDDDDDAIWVADSRWLNERCTRLGVQNPDSPQKRTILRQIMQIQRWI